MIRTEIEESQSRIEIMNAMIDYSLTEEEAEDYISDQRWLWEREREEREERARDELGREYYNRQFPERDQLNVLGE